MKKPIISIIGDASIPSGSKAEKLAEKTGALLIENDYRVLTGGLGGIMEAACRGAKEVPDFQPGDSIGVLPGNDPQHANPYVDIVIPTGLDMVRNTVVAHGEAVIAVGGGAGTLSEMAFAWLYKRLILAFRIEGWSGKLADTRIDERIRYPEIPEDKVFGINQPEEIIPLLDTYLKKYNRHHDRIQPSLKNG